MICRKATLKRTKKELARFKAAAVETVETATQQLTRASADIKKYRAMTHSIVIAIVTQGNNGASFLVAQPAKKNLIVKTATGAFEGFEVGAEVIIPPPTATELSVFCGEEGYKCIPFTTAFQATAGSDNLWLSYSQVHQVNGARVGAHTFASVFYISQESEDVENYYAVTLIPPAFANGKLDDNASHAPPFALIPLNFEALGYAIYRKDTEGVHFEAGTGKVVVTKEVDFMNHHHPVKYTWTGDFKEAIDAATKIAEMKLTIGEQGGEHTTGTRLCNVL